MYCSKCGNKIDDDARFCDKCGFSLDGESEVQMPPTAGGIGHNPMLPLFIGICVAAVAVSAVIIMLILKPFGENDRRNRHDMNESVETVVENTEVLIREGDYIVFGRYEQDGDLSNGPEPIEWEIVAEENGRMLLISRYILDCQPYNTELEDVTWETCSLRAWLNDYFYNTAFNSVEQNRILSVTLSNPDNAYYGFTVTPVDMEGAMNPPFEGKLCVGKDLSFTPYEEIWDRGIDLSYLIKAYSDVTSLHPELSFWGTEYNGGRYWIDYLFGTDSVRKQIEAEVSAEAIKASWQDDLSDFRVLRRKYLLYPEE